jgi:hypothetical protein
MAIANANCEFMYCDVGTNGSLSDGGVIANTKFYEKLINNDLKFQDLDAFQIHTEFLNILSLVMKPLQCVQASLSHIVGKH